MKVTFLNMVTGAERVLDMPSQKSILFNGDVLYFGDLAVAMFQNYRWHELNLAGDFVGGWNDSGYTDIRIERI